MQDFQCEENALREVRNQSARHCGKKVTGHFEEFLRKLDEQNDSEDEGIEDYNLGGYHPVHIGEVLINRYVVIQKLGWGHFSTVWLCKDFKFKTFVAVKIQKSSSHYMEAAFDEVEILQKVEERCHSKQWGRSRDDAHVVGMLNAFIYKTIYGNHFCMVFEILSCNLLEIIKRYNFEGVPLGLCQQISKQVLEGLDFLHRVCGIIHTDLKPQNVMVCLSDEQMKEIVESGQLLNNQLFAERTRILQKALGINTHPTQNEHLEKINEIEEKLKGDHLSKNQKKNLKKKLRKEKFKQNDWQGQSQSENQGVVNPLGDLFDLKKGKITFNRGEKLKAPFKIKIADLGNACWKHHHFSSQIQTRQYRSPEVILRQSYNETSDMWSFACLMYEMLTGDLMFHPKQSETWSKNEDHLAQIQELIGPFHPHYIARSPKGKKYFNKDGTMKNCPDLCHFPLSIILQIKNKINKEEAIAFANFLEPAMIAEPELRISAQKALQLPWLKRTTPANYIMQQNDYAILQEQFDANESQFQIQHPKEVSQSSKHTLPTPEKQQSKQHDRFADIRLIDQSFTDIAYIGYSTGISLVDLDSRGNWQFAE